VTSLRYPQLSGLGRNPAAPDDVLVRLAAHPAGRHGITMRRGIGPVADGVVEALLAQCDKPTAFSLHLIEMSPAMRHRIGEHPDPAIRNAYIDFVHNAVNRQVRLPVESLEKCYGLPRAVLVQDLDPKLRAMVAYGWWDRPMPVQERLLADPDPRVRAAVTQTERPGIPPQWWDRCLADPATRANAARYVPMPQNRFVELVDTGDDELIRAVATNPHLSAEMVGMLLDREDPFVRVPVAYSRHVDADTRDRLLALVEADRAAGNIDAAVALDYAAPALRWLPATPLAQRLAYLDSPHVPLRLALAGCRDLPPQAWDQLDNDPNVSVRRAAARRPDTPAPVLERLVRANGEVFHVRPLLVEHPNFPRHRLRTLVDEPDPQVRYVALQDADLPTDLLARLVEEPSLRHGVAEHPRASADLLEQLLTDPDPPVADAAAANPALPRSQMHRILIDAGL
jgi:hypothetical protein